MKKQESTGHDACIAHHRAIRDTMDALSGKWKIPIIGSLSFGKQRFMVLLKNVEGIAAKMLSKELQELELVGLVTRTVVKTKPITVEYELTENGHLIKPVVDAMVTWGQQHRARIKSSQ